MVQGGNINVSKNANIMFYDTLAIDTYLDRDIEKIDQEENNSGLCQKPKKI